MAETYKVEGMTCGGCARSVTNAITKAAPGAKVDVDLPGATVTIDGEIAAEEVRKVVEAAGFDYKGQA
ncbi:copper chaperone [uncultured Gammaproteobacteria bacterium]